MLPLHDAVIAATRVTVLPAADARLLSTQVRADLPAELPPSVVPGTAAKVLLPTGMTKRLVMPAEANVRRGELTATYVVGDDAATPDSRGRSGGRRSGRGTGWARCGGTRAVELS